MLNYKNKYLKYKNKYLNLKKQIGGNLDNINKLSGPVSVDYYNNDKVFTIEDIGSLYVNIENGDIKIPLQFVKILDYSKENNWYKSFAFKRLAENNINIVEYINKM